MVFKIVPLSEGELWDCLACEMGAGRDVDAAYLVVEGVPGWRGSVKTGLCAQHAQAMERAEFRETYLLWAQEKYVQLVCDNRR
jgi:hypothetical protein